MGIPNLFPDTEKRDNLVSKIIIHAPVFTNLPREMAENWQKNITHSIPQMVRKIKKAIHIPDDYDKKIVNRAVKSYSVSINPDFVSRSGLTREDIIAKHRKSLEKQKEQYFKNVNKVFRKKDGISSKNYMETLPDGLKEYAYEYVNFVLPMIGHKTLGKGLATLGTMWLAGNQKVNSFLRDTDKVIFGKPILITDTLRKAKFQIKLRNRLVFWGNLLLRTFDSYWIKEANKDINLFVQVFKMSEFAPLISGGLSYIDFIVERIPDKTQPKKLKENLCLDIQVSLA
jgi:hypothetical protein